MRRVLIVHTWGIGDWLFVTPVITVLKETWPDAHIEVILGTLALGIYSFLMPFFIAFSESNFSGTISRILLVFIPMLFTVMLISRGRVCGLECHKFR